MSLFARRNNSERHRTLGKDNVKDVTSSSSNHRADNAFEAVHRLRKTVDHFFSPFSVPWGRYIWTSVSIGAVDGRLAGSRRGDLVTVESVVKLTRGECVKLPVF
jgi:hypothetical protein